MEKSYCSVRQALSKKVCLPHAVSTLNLEESECPTETYENLKAEML